MNRCLFPKLTMVLTLLGGAMGVPPLATPALALSDQEDATDSASMRMSLFKFAVD